MTIQAVALISGGCLLYVAIGVISPVVYSYMAGRRGHRALDGPEGVVYAAVWPVLVVALLFILSVEKYDDLMCWAWSRGKTSVMPPENELPGRRIDGKEEKKP